MPDFIIVAFIGFLVGMFVGAVIWYYLGSPKCDNHKLEKIIDTIDSNGKGTVVYMCKKCGKRKITKVK